MSSVNRLVHMGAAAALAALALATGRAAEASPLLLFEPATGQVLYAEEPDQLWHPASVTKLMTAYLVFDAVKVGRLAWDDDVPLSDHARGQPATRIGLRGGIKLNVEQAVRGLILRSANDFAVALAERVGGTEEAFVRAMNDTAKRLGMTRTVFRNPHGLPDPEQVTTARDLATLTTALLRDFPDRAEVFSTPTVRIHKGTFHSQNDLLRTVDGADGMKTGFTCASGYNVVASATRNGHRLVAIVLGEYNRHRRSERATELLEAGFAHLSGDPALKTAVLVPPAPAFKLRHASALPLSEPRPFMPITLRTLPIAPAETAAPGDIGRDVRTRTCRGYSGFTKPESEHDGNEEAADTEASAIVVQPPRPAAEAKAALVPVAKVAPKKATSGARRAVPQKTEPAATRAKQAAVRRPQRTTPALKPKKAAEQGPASAMHHVPGSGPVTFGN